MKTYNKNQIRSNLFAISKVHNITVDKNYISLGWADKKKEKCEKKLFKSIQTAYNKRATTLSF